MVASLIQRDDSTEMIRFHSHQKPTYVRFLDMDDSVIEDFVVLDANRTGPSTGIHQVSIELLSSRFD